MSQQEPAPVSSPESSSSMDHIITRQDQTDIDRVITWQQTHTGRREQYMGIKPKNENALRSSSQMGNGRPYPPALTGDVSAYIVDFDGPGDPTHPQNWSTLTK